jgi:N-acetylneuraminic acid mutarotase
MFAFRNIMRTLLAACCLALLFSNVAHAQKWSRAAAFPEPAEELYGIGAGGKFYVFGGIAPGWKPKGLVYEYDPANDTWTKKNNMPLASHHVALTELNGKIYMMGGFKYPDQGKPSWVPIDNAWEYDPAGDTWKALAPLPTKRGSPNAVAHKGRIYVIGGAGVHPGSKAVDIHPARPHRALDVNEVYDPATNTWEKRNPMPTARNHAAAGMVNDKIYVIAGRLGAAFITRASNTDVVEEYDPATDQWGPLRAPMPTARSAVSWGTYKGRIYVAGGEERSGGPWQRTFRAVEAYDPKSNSWSQLPPMSFPRHGMAGDIVDGKFRLVSGDAASGGAPGTELHTDVHEVLDLEAKK